MITTFPRSLKNLVEFFLPRIENTIEPTVEPKIRSEIDELLLKKIGKKDKNKFTFSVCEAVGFIE